MDFAKNFAQIIRAVYDDVRKALRVKVDGALEGSFSVIGAQNFIDTQEVQISSTSWTEIILRKSERNALNIQNRSSVLGEEDGVNDIYISGSDLGTVTKGMRIIPAGERQYTISNVEIWVKAKQGTPTITVEAVG
jgi:hypothetical protein